MTPIIEEVKGSVIAPAPDLAVVYMNESARELFETDGSAVSKPVIDYH